MFVKIEEPSTGVTLMQRRLSPSEIMDHAAFADKYARSIDRDIEWGKDTFEGSDIRVVFFESPKTQSWKIWSDEYFDFKCED